MRGGGDSAEQSSLATVSQFYDDAHTSHGAGSNGYYRVSNAITAARNEQLRGNPGRTRLWVARAALGIGWTLANDPRHLLAATRWKN